METHLRTHKVTYNPLSLSTFKNPATHIHIPAEDAEKSENKCQQCTRNSWSPCVPYFFLGFWLAYTIFRKTKRTKWTRPRSPSLTGRSCTASSFQVTLF